MIQRIQTIYLLLATIIMIALNWMPLAYFGDLEFLTYGIFSEFGIASISITTYPIAVIVIASVILAAMAIFMYKNRIKQAKIVALSIFLDVMFYPIFTVYLWYSKEALANIDNSFSFALIIPVISIILKALANKAIKADEKLVRSADRIR